jgi:hypothetical protein
MKPKLHRYFWKLIEKLDAEDMLKISYACKKDNWKESEDGWNIYDDLLITILQESMRGLNQTVITIKEYKLEPYEKFLTERGFKLTKKLYFIEEDSCGYIDLRIYWSGKSYRFWREHDHTESENAI